MVRFKWRCFMSYFLRQTKKKKGTYLEVYDSYWDKDKKQSRTKYVESIGFLEDLISDEIPDPVEYYKEYVKQKNEERSAVFAEETRPRAFSAPMEQPHKTVFIPLSCR